MSEAGKSEVNIDTTSPSKPSPSDSKMLRAIPVVANSSSSSPASRPPSIHSRPAKMMAAVLAGPGEIRLQEFDIPEPGPQQVRVKVEGCGLCASNLPAWQGRPWFEYPLPKGSPGHEGWGVIETLGKEVRGLKEGQRVAFFSNSAFAEYDLASTDAIVPLPPSLDDQPFPGEPFGCAFNVFERSRIRAGDTVAVVGVGFIGAVVIALAKAAQARVLAIGRRPCSLDLARELGADEVIAMKDHQQIIEKVRELSAGQFCDRVIEATGEQWPLDLAAELCRERARLIIAGYHQDSPRQVNMQLWNWRGLDVINAHEREMARYREGTERAIQAISQNKLDPSLLLTHRFPLSQLAEAFHTLETRPAGFMKAVVLP